MFGRTLTKFKTYKSDAAPFFFFIDIFPIDTTIFDRNYLIKLASSVKLNPIMPIPMRIDKVFNGEKTVLIRPREPISFNLVENITAIINPYSFLKLGLKKLLYFTEIRSLENLQKTIPLENIKKWWNYTRFLYGNLVQLEKDFASFSRAYLYTLVEAKLSEEDLINAAKNYCQLIVDICKERISKNAILKELEGNQKVVQLYKKKKAGLLKNWRGGESIEIHPRLIDIEIFNFLNMKSPLNKKGLEDSMKDSKSYILKYIPLLFYDDLLECMLQNLEKLENNEDELIDPSLLLENGVIILKNVDEMEEIDLNKFLWINNFEKIDIDSLYNFENSMI